MKKMMLVAAMLLAVAPACHKKSDCSSAIKGAVDRMIAQEKNDSKIPPEMKKQAEEMMNKMASTMTTVMTKACVDDKWSADVISCINNAKTDDDLHACDDKLTPAQKANMKKAEAKAMGMGDETPPPPAEAPAEGSAAPAEGSAAAAGSAEAAPTAAAGDLPADCVRYKADVDKLASCDKFPAQAREQTKKAFDQASAAWANLPPAGKQALANGCKTAADTLETSAKTVCGW